MKLLHSAVILEGITHIEDLPLREFIRTVESLKDKIVTEKLDGSNLWFGLDDNGVFTSREGKSPKNGRFYSVDDYAMVANFNGFRAAHLAVEQIESEIREHLEEGDMVEMEVLFGRQPNTVTYGVSNKNFIVILRGVNGTPDKRVNALSDAINNKKVTIESTIVSSPDGDSIELNDERMVWEFTQVKPIDNKQVDTSEAMGLLKALKKYMTAPNASFPDKTNEEVATLSLTSFPKEERENAKKARDAVNDTLQNDFKIPIKELLLNRLVRKIKPMLQADDLHPSEDIGVEGVVVRDPVTGSQTKIVDKDVFTAINTFNSSARALAAGLVRTTDQEAAAEMRGGAFGQAKIKIANLLGAKELSLSSGVKRYITKFKQDSVQSTADALADNLDLHNFSSVKSQISGFLKDALDEVNTILDSFKNESDQYKLTLKTGKEIGITPEVMKRTLTAFAETKKDIIETNKNVSNSKNPSELIMGLYGKTINAIFSGGDSEVKESMSLLKSINEDAEGAAISAGGESTAEVKSTISTNIAPVETRLFQGGRTIVRRKRNFVKPKKFPIPTQEGKFSLLKNMQEEWAHVKDMKFATDVDDMANAKNDIEFKQLRNTVSMDDNITPASVNQYLDKAHELNDEVDTVTFGMETDTGHIVKVYVNASQADEFESSLADMLSKEDETEAVINALADKFDIVDVEWPKEMSEPSATPDVEDNLEGDTPTDDFGDVEDMDFATASDSEESSDEETDSTDDGSDSGEPSDDEPTDDEPTGDESDMDFNTASDEDQEPSDDEPSVVSSEDDISTDEDEEPSDDVFTDDMSDEDDDVFTDDMSDEDDASTDDMSDEDEEPSDEDDQETDDFGQPIKKRKPKTEKTEEDTMESTTFGQLFKAKLLEGSKKPRKDKNDDEDKEASFLDKHISGDASLEKILKSTPTVKGKAIITLLVKLGAPSKAMLLHRAELKKTTENAAEMFITNASFRLWTKKLLEALSKVQAFSESTDLSDRLSNKYQHMLYDVLKALGLPESVERSGQRQLLANIRDVAKLIISDNDVKIYFKSLADILGVSGNSRNMPEVNESFLAEQNNAAEDAVNNLLTALGFTLDKPISISRQERMAAVKTSLMKIQTSSTLVNKIEMITKLINDKTKQTAKAQPQFAHQEFNNSAIIAEKAEDRGEWNIGKMASNGLVLTLDDVKIKISKEEAEKLAIGLDKNKKVSVRAHGDTRYNFKPLKHGEYSVSEHVEDEDEVDEILISKEQVQEILTIINEE